MPNPANTYRDHAILSATPSQLVTMLYDRLLLDLRTAHTALETGDDVQATYRLSHAGQIVAMLAGSLDTTVWDEADNLLALYMYVTQAIMSVTASRNPATVVECVALLEPLRDAWHQAAAVLARQPEWNTADSTAEKAVFAVA